MWISRVFLAKLWAKPPDIITYHAFQNLYRVEFNQRDYNRRVASSNQRWLLRFLTKKFSYLCLESKRLSVTIL